MPLPPLALSTSWNARRHEEGGAMLEEIRDLGFAEVEISHGLGYSKWPGVRQAVTRGVVRVVSLHNFCPHPIEVLNRSPNCFQYTDNRPELRAAAVRHTLATLENAALVGAGRVVLHLGTAGNSMVDARLERMWGTGRFLSRGYVKAKLEALQKRRKLGAAILERVMGCLEQIVPVAQKHGLKLAVESRESFDEFPNEEELELLFRNFPEEVLGYWHDFGHSARRQTLTWSDQEQELTRWRSRLLGCHVQDFLPPQEDHLPLGQGGLDFVRLLAQFPEKYVAVLELGSRAKREEVQTSLELWNQYGKKLG